MGRDEVNIAGLAVTLEGALTGWTVCLGLGNDQASTGRFHDPSPLMTTPQAIALWHACDSTPISKQAARAAMPVGVRAWFDTLSTALQVGSQVVDLQARALQAIYASQPPVPPRATVSGGLPAVI